MPPLVLFAEATASSGSDAGWILGALSMILTALFGYLGNRDKGEQAEKLKATDAKVKELEHDLKGCVEKHAEAEKDSAAARTEIAGLKAQNGGQQGMIDTLTQRIIGLVGAMHAQGLPTGSGPHVPLADDRTDEHTPLGGGGAAV